MKTIASPIALTCLCLAFVSLCFLDSPASAAPSVSQQPENRPARGSSGEASGGGSTTTQTIKIDYLWPGEAPHFLAALRAPTWVDVPIVSGGTGSDSLRIQSLRILTGSRNWGFTICGSKTQPETCAYASPAGWKLWYGDSQVNLDYQDLDGDASPEIHFLVTPFDGGWMTFRAQIEGEQP
jgi:hypothetical protein